MTCTPTSSPTRRAAAAPASVAAFTEPTSPRMIAVTSPASTFCQLTRTTLAVLSMASAASIMPTRPRVSIMPSASPTGGLSFATGQAGFYHLPALAAAQGGDVRHVVAGVPAIDLRVLLDGEHASVLRMHEGAAELGVRHAGVHLDPAAVQPVEHRERELDRQPRVGERGQGVLVVRLDRRVILGERELHAD